VKHLRLTDGSPEQHVVVFETGEEVVDGLTGWAVEHRLPASSFTGIGAFRRATLGFYDLDAQEYAHIEVDEQVELLSLAGDITLDGESGRKVHGHVVCGRRDGSTVGGHLLAATVRPTLELVVTVSARQLQRRHDPATGLALIDPEQGSAP
jgi:predicted DNA-binding protein with PD1-like motif